MQPKSEYTKIKRELEDWCKYLKKAKNDDYNAYKKKIVKWAHKDQDLSKVLVQCFGEMIQQQNKFYNYKSDTQSNQDLKALRRLLSILTERKDITLQDSKQILGWVVTDLQNGLQLYLNKVKSKQKLTINDLDQIWQEVFFIDQRKFWNYIQNDRIQDQKLILFYQLSRLNGDIHILNSYYLEYIRNLQELKWKNLIKPISIYSNKNEALEKIAYENCLFLHPRLIEDVTRQLYTLQLYLKECFGSDTVFQLFGSLRNRTTLINENDGDVTIFVKNNFHSKQTLLQSLRSRMKSQIQERKSGLDSLRSVYIKKHRIPYLKLIYSEPNHNEVTFKGSNFLFKTTDLLIDNHHGVKNSNIIAKYTRNQHVMKLCCLTKLWAKNSKLINTQDPRGHLSSYGLNLMTIYYLIRTGQASYVEKINISHFVIPRKPRIKKNLLQNLKGFFQFYAQGSQFYRQKDIVCLIKNPPKSSYNAEILINMYDFIDETNPGRMKVDKKLDFFRFVNRALTALNEGYISRVETIFTSRL